jgi:hypothetical protein
MQSAHLDRLRDFDDRLVEAAAGGDEETFGRLFSQMLAYVRSNGQPVPDDEIADSDVVLPPPDTTLEEARELFRGEGLLPV